jgi:hypothetical protein
MVPEALRSAVAGSFPELACSRFTLLTAGWDCVAVDADDQLIFKFPRHQAAEKALIMEASLLAIIRPVVTMQVPDLTLHHGPSLFSRHAKLKGEHLVAAQYELLPDDILRRAWPVLPTRLHLYAEQAIGAWQRLPPDPYGTTYGFFDGHGWNMAFDHAGKHLNGIYDFADSGFGPLHQECVYLDWIARDLTARIISEYEALTGLALDRERIELLSAVLRLSQLAEYAEDAEHAPAMLKAVVDWVAASCSE